MQTNFRVGVIVPSGGTGQRFGGDIPKQYLPVGGVPSIVRSLHTITSLPQCVSIVIAAATEQVDVVRRLLSEYGVTDIRIHIVAGGVDRQGSVYNALQHPSMQEVDVVGVHDAVRPFASVSLWTDVLALAHAQGCAIPVLPVTDTIKRLRDNVVVETVDRSVFRRVQTPQAFQAHILRHAYEQAMVEHWVGTDCASLCERVNNIVHCVPGDEYNIKITTPFDLVVAEAILARN